MESFALGDSVLPIPGKVQAKTVSRAVIKQGFKHGRGWVLSLPGVPSLAPSGHQGLFLLLAQRSPWPWAPFDETWFPSLLRQLPILAMGEILIEPVNYQNAGL